MTIPNAVKTTLIEIYHRLQGTEIRWALTGSMAFAIQGIPLRPNDIDIQTDRNGAFAIEELFKPNMTRPVRFSEARRIRSYFGEFYLNDVKVEIMGDIQKRQNVEKWEAPISLPEIIVEVPYHGLNVPVLPLDYEIQSYRNMGRQKRADQLEMWLGGKD
ncbi:MAG TPA: hypothetical protein VFT51_14150 [Bacillales bacterium]|nr:hypothetical protein [Bacillales bacterium]